MPKNAPVKEVVDGSFRRVYVKRAQSPQAVVIYTAPTALSGSNPTIFKDTNIDILLALYASHDYLNDIKRYEDADRLQLRINMKEEQLFNTNSQQFIDYQ